MSLVEFIGFVVSLVGLIFLTVRNYQKERNRRQHSETLSDEEVHHQEHHEEHHLKELLRSIHLDEEEEEPVSTPPPLPLPKVKPQTMIPFKQKPYEFQRPIEGYRQESKIETRQLKTKIEDRFYHEDHDKISASHDQAYEVNIKVKKSRALQMIQGLPSLGRMVIIKEVLGRPLSLRHPEDDR